MKSNRIIDCEFSDEELKSYLVDYSLSFSDREDKKFEVCSFNF